MSNRDSTKESNLVTVGTSDISGNDFVRVLDGDASRKMTLTAFGSSISPILTTLGFVSNANSEQSVAVKIITTGYNVALTDRVILANTSGGALTVNLPSAASVWDAATSVSQQFTIKKTTTDINKVNILPAGIETIDGNTAYNLVGPTLPAITIVSNGSNWVVIAE